MDFLIILLLLGLSVGIPKIFSYARKNYDNKRLLFCIKTGLIIGAILFIIFGRLIITGNL